MHTLGYPLPTTGYPMPVLSYTMPTMGYTIPTMGYTMLTMGYPIPIMGYTMLTMGYPMPIMGYPMPTMGYTLGYPLSNADNGLSVKHIVRIKNDYENEQKLYAIPYIKYLYHFVTPYRARRGFTIFTL